MKILDNKSNDIISLYEGMEYLKRLVKKTLNNRTPCLNGEKYLSNKDVCRLLHISIRTLQIYRDTGVISFIQISGKILYKESDIHKLLEDNYKKSWYNDI